jgi:hypothetical protein
MKLGDTRLVVLVAPRKNRYQRPGVHQHTVESHTPKPRKCLRPVLKSFGAFLTLPMMPRREATS